MQQLYCQSSRKWYDLNPLFTRMNGVPTDRYNPNLVYNMRQSTIRLISSTHLHPNHRIILGQDQVQIQGHERCKIRHSTILLRRKNVERQMGNYHQRCFLQPMQTHFRAVSILKTTSTRNITTALLKDD